MVCTRCARERAGIALFCECGKLWSQHELRNVRVAGFVGVLNSTSTTIEKFWATGDPSVFSAK